MKRQSLYVLTLSVVALAGCQNNDIAGLQDLNDGTVRYAVSFGDALQTRAAVLDAETPLALSDKEGKLVIPMGFEVSEGISLELDTVLTRGTQVNTGGDDSALGSFSDVVSGFTVKAYNGDGVEKLFQSVSWSGTAWTATPVAYWPQATILNFLAYANMPLDQSATIASTGVSTEHTVPATASQQKDILFGYYQGNGGNTGTAEIRFNHPLTAVRFKYGEMDGNPTIKRISLSGVAPSGTATMIQDGSIAWSEIDSHNGIVSQENLSGLPVNATTSVIGEPFLIIPQNVATLNVKVMVTFTDDTVLEGILNTGAWKAGYTNTYTLGYTNQEITYTFDLKNDNDCAQFFTNTTSSMSKTIPVISKKTVDEVSADHDWLIASYQVEGEEVVNVNTTSFNGVEGLTVEKQGNNLKVTSAAKQAVSPNSHTYWINGAGREDHLDWSPADWTSETSSNPVDLSRYDVVTDTKNAHQMTTANCYIIRHAGTYKLPLVYGNAMSDGTENVQSYYYESTSGSNRLTRFVNHSGNGITSAFIENNGVDCIPTACAIIWYEGTLAIKNMTLEGTSNTTYNSSNVRYLQFTVDKDVICQSNALICIYKDLNGNSKYDDGECIWSWHIWMTNNADIIANSGIDVINPGGKTYKFFPLNSIGWIDPTIYWEKKDVTVVLKQNNSGNTETVVLRQPRITGQSNGTYYQYGRKDPLSRNSSNWSHINSRQEIPYGIKNPKTFISGKNNEDGQGSDWCTYHYYNLWTGKKSILGESEQDADMIKTIYDPSPKGYKVPASGGFTGFTANGAWRLQMPSGYYYFTRLGESNAVDLNAPLIYFPAVGYRLNASGVINELGACGDFWAANPGNYSKNSSAFFLEFYLGDNADLSHYYRSYGFNIRPVKQ
ncbi:MAG: fimbrillin family protein [Bacteroidaceae bacterium]|nr:fimbrillin family protein [Bacteroidaceae bacterium]